MSLSIHLLIFSKLKDHNVQLMADGVITVSSVVLRVDLSSDDEAKEVYISWNDEVCSPWMFFINSLTLYLF